MAITYEIHKGFNQQLGRLEFLITFNGTNNSHLSEEVPISIKMARLDDKDISYGEKNDSFSMIIPAAIFTGEYYDILVEEGVASAEYHYYDYTAIPSEQLKYNLKLTLGEDSYEQELSVVFVCDDLLLSTDTQVLNIKYNPDITSMKITTGDAITQTLGSQYPYFRRNGIMNYKQFNIGGLISYHEDSAFWNVPDLTGYGLSEADIERVKEKQFREAVLDFLYDPKPKILRSTTEGCMIVKLTGISLTPNKQLGRSIYSFTAQATEYRDPSIENLVKYGKDFDVEVVTA